MSIVAYNIQTRPTNVRFSSSTPGSTPASGATSDPGKTSGAANATPNNPPQAPVKLKLFRSLLKGFFDPIVSVGKFIFNNPVKAGIYLGATLVALQNPLIATGLSVGLFAYGGYQLATGVAQIISGLRNKNNERANNGAERVGHGIFDVAFTYNAAFKGLKNLRSTLQLLRETKGLTMVQRLNIFLRQVPKGASPEELNAVPKTFGETWGYVKDRFLNLFNAEAHAVPDNTNFRSTTETIVKNKAQVIELLEKNKDLWGVNRVLDAAKKLNVSADKVSDVPKLLAALYKDPELASTLAQILERESNIQRIVSLGEDIKSVLAGSSEAAKVENTNPQEPVKSA